MTEYELDPSYILATVYDRERLELVAEERLRHFTYWQNFVLEDLQDVEALVVPDWIPDLVMPICSPQVTRGWNPLPLAFRELGPSFLVFSEDQERSLYFPKPTRISLVRDNIFAAHFAMLVHLAIAHNSITDGEGLLLHACRDSDYEDRREESLRYCSEPMAHFGYLYADRVPVSELIPFPED